MVDRRANRFRSLALWVVTAASLLFVAMPMTVRIARAGQSDYLSGGGPIPASSAGEPSGNFRFICNASHYGGSTLLAPRADLFDPEFQVVCVKDDRRRSYLKLVLNTLAGRYPNTPDIRRFTAGKLVVTGKKAVQADGDFVTYSPVRISCVEQFLQIIV